jgi:carboxypeptidase Taq
MNDDMTGPASGPYSELAQELREVATLASSLAVLAWDQETMMPAEGAGLRADQLALLSGIVHERRTSTRIGELISECESDPDLTSDDRVSANLREMRREFDRATLLPVALVRQMAQTSSMALEAWKDARSRSDFAAFAPWLEKVVALNRSKAQCYGAHRGAAMYDALMEDYEPGVASGEVEQVFTMLRERLTPLIAAVGKSSRRPDDAPNRIELPIAQQQEFNRRVAERIGFSFEAGRLDTSTHPFCEGIGPGDTRLTTRYRADGFADALSSTLHEAGHGLYEQGLPKDGYFGQPLGESASLGIHESQSRLWENMVGRSHAFWEWALPEARKVFGSPLDRFSTDDLYRASNIVQPGLIRVDSDEATYNLHIMLRFDVERALLAGDLPVADVPGVWTERMRTDLGVEVPDDRRGSLQDIHWSMGSIGYFPTYTLGNLYAAQLWEAVRRAVPDLDEQIRRGEFGGLLGWLRENVHRHGRRYSAAELCERATGSPLSSDPLLRHLEGKLQPIYGL